VSFFISPNDLWLLIGNAAPQIIDVRRRDIYDGAPGLLPTALWREPGGAMQWSTTLDPKRPIVLACRAGHERSQAAAATLREQGLAARVLEGGYAGWSEAGLPLVNKPRSTASR
jgi:rhodanese-related sulfurtransferase